MSMEAGAIKRKWYHSVMEEKDKKLIRMIGVLSTVGLTMVFATIIGFFFGLWLDRLFGTSPWMAGLFLLIGIFAGFRNLFLYVKKSQQELDEQNRDQK